MRIDEIRNLWRDAAERAIGFRVALPDRLQRPTQDYAESVARFDEPLPASGETASEILEQLVDRADPGLHAMTGSRFFGWVIGASHPVGVAADWMTSAWGQNAGNHHASPAAAAAEATAARWLLQLLDLPRQASVGFVTGATVANFVCLAAARHALLARAGWDVESQGLFGAPPIQVLIGDDAHTTVFSALQFLGLGRDRVIRVATNSQGAIDAAAFAQVLAGVEGPKLAILQAGQINTGAFDPFSQIVPLARAAGAWTHVDGAFGLWARACPARAELAAADSWAVDGHKWLQTPYDSGYAIVRDADAHQRAMTIAASYLPLAAQGERDPSHFVPELSRRARGFATWALIKAFGRDGIASMIEGHCNVARRMAERLAQEPGVAVLNDVVLNQLIVRFGSDQSDEQGDHLTIRTVANLQSDGVCFAGGAKWRGRQAMRVSVIGFETDEREGLRSVEAMLAAFRKAHNT